MWHRAAKPDNTGYANDGVYRVKAPKPQSTLRRIRTDWTRHFRKPVVLAGLAGVCFVLGMSGPFDTIDTLTPIPRLVYWTLTVWLTYGLGAVYYIALFGEDEAPRWTALVLSAPAAGLMVLAVLIGLNRVFFGNWVDSIGELLRIWGFASIVAFIVTALSALSYARPAASPAPSQATAAPPLLRRLPLDKRGTLVSLSVQDHYVQVVTDQGREMLLMRLRDAMEETAPHPGLQVHRSHWVARDQVTAVRRRGDGAMLTTSAGDEIPASRSFMPELRRVGLLPAKT